MAAKNGAIKLVAGNSNPQLAEFDRRLSQNPGGPGRGAAFRRHGDLRRDPENVRGSDVFVLQSTSFPANDHLMELLIIMDALRRSSARRITAVVPYFGYARQDRKPGPRTPISAKLVANLITRAGADRVMTLDLHAGQIQGFFDIPTDNLFASPVMVRDIKDHYKLDNLMVVSPDVGGVVRARGLAKRINAPLAIIDKRRERAGESEVMNVIGEVQGRACILVDDIVEFRRHAGERRRGAARPRRQVGRRLHHPRRAVGRRGGARNQLQAQGTGDHRLDPADRGSPGARNIRVLPIDTADRRSDRAHRSGRVGVEPVRLTAPRR